MNKLTIIGNLTADPQMRTVNTANGSVSVCDFTVAVNSRKQGEDAVFFRCTAWRGLADVIGKFAGKGKKVCVVGPVSARTYTDRNGATRVSLEVTAEDFEFCERKDGAESQREQPQEEPPQQKDQQTGMAVIDDQDLPF